MTEAAPPADGWVEGRAGMLYRDLLADSRSGPHFAWHIRIVAGGPVPDYVHFHDVRVQIIYCLRGWIRVVYEDQGPPFVLRPGDCVLQPPGIRHRVLECAAESEVVEVGAPGGHATRADEELELPTQHLRPEREFGGQRFVRHQAAQATWQPLGLAGFECRDTGVAAASAGVAGVRVTRVCGSPPVRECRHSSGLWFHFVLAGAVTLRCEGRDARRCAAGDALLVPAGARYTLEDCAPDLQLLEVTLPAGKGPKPSTRSRTGP